MTNQKTLKKIEKLIKDYVKPLDYSLKCKCCRKGLTQWFYKEFVEKGAKKICMKCVMENPKYSGKLNEEQKDMFGNVDDI